MLMRVAALCAASMAVLLTCVSPAIPVVAAQAPSEVSALVIPPGRINRAVLSLDKLAHAMLRKTNIPGMAIAVVHDGRAVYVKGFGVRRAGTKLRVDGHTRFELASLSKPVGAAVIAGAVGRGCVHWTDPVATYLPGFALADADTGNTVTIADMYAHRSGLPDHAGDLLEDLGFDRTTILQRLALVPLDPFRITYHYTNFGITAAAEAVAHACDTTWEKLSHDILYRPLGMTDTSSLFLDYENATNHADLHVREGAVWRARYVRDADAQSPAGGVSSSAADMAKYLRLELANGRFAGRPVINTPALLETRNPNLMSSPLATPNSRASFYGLGIAISYDSAGRLRLSHSGAFASGAATTILMLPSERLGIVVLTNAAPIGAPEALAAEFMDLAEFGAVQFDWLAGYGRLFKQLEHNSSTLAGQKPPAQPVPAHSLDAYTGTYASRYYGPATVAADDGRLVLALGPKRMMFALTHWSGNVFSYLPRGENAVGISAVTFALGNTTPHARTMTVEFLNAEKLGTFTRDSP